MNREELKELLYRAYSWGMAYEGGGCVHSIDEYVEEIIAEWEKTE